MTITLLQVSLQQGPGVGGGRGLPGDIGRPWLMFMAHLSPLGRGCEMKTVWMPLVFPVCSTIFPCSFTENPGATYLFHTDPGGLLSSCLLNLVMFSTLSGGHQKKRKHQ